MTSTLLLRVSAINMSETLCPSEDVTRNDMVHTIGGRLHVFVSFIASELRQDSWRTKRTSTEWKDSLSRLWLAATPLTQCVRGDSLSIQVIRFRQQISNAMSELESEGDQRISQFAALDNIREAQCVLLKMIASVRGAALRPDYQTNAPSEASVEWEFEHGMREFARAIDSKQPISICIASRMQFLKSYYTAVIQPRLWNQERHNRLITLHEQAISVVGEGMELDSLTRRLEKLRRYSPEEFTEISGRRLDQSMKWISETTCHES